MKTIPARIFYALVSVGLTSGAVARISTESPFVPKNGQAMAAPAENSPIELRGVMTTADGVMFGIYEPGSQKGNWVKANETGFGYVVRAFDAEKSSASVEYQGRVQTLTLKEAKFDGTAAAAAPMIAGGSPVRPSVPGAVASPANPADEAKRLENVANEVRRRRAARQAATQTQAPAAGTATAMPAPAVTPATP